MLIVTSIAGKYFEYAVEERLSREDLLAYYRCLEERHQQVGRLRVLVRVINFRGYTGPAAWWVLLTNEHKVLRKVSRYAALTDQRWFARLIGVINLLVPGIRLRAFGPEQESAALTWLRA